MVASFGSNETKRPIKPYRDLLERVKPVVLKMGSMCIDEYDVMAVLLRRTYGKSVWECKCGDWQAQISRAKQHLGEDASRLFDNLVILKGKDFGRMAKFSFDYAALSKVEGSWEESPTKWLEQVFMRTRLGIGLMPGHRIVADLQIDDPIPGLRRYCADEPSQIEHVAGQLRSVFAQGFLKPANAFNQFYEDDGWTVNIDHSVDVAHVAQQLREAWSKVE